MKNRRMRTRMYGGVRGRKTKKVGRNSKIFVFLLLDYFKSNSCFLKRLYINLMIDNFIY